MKFRTVYERVRVTSCPGDPIAADFGFRKDKDGNDVLEIVGIHSIYDEIQAYKDSCDLNKILERFRLTGDPTVLQQRQGFYGDVAEFPKTYAEFLNLSLKAQEMFATLPADIRSQFDNDVDKFICSIGTEKFDSVFKQTESTDIPIKESEVKSNE